MPDLALHPEEPAGQHLDRQAAVTMALLLIIVALANIDRFILGAAGPLRAHDLADNTVTGLAACGEFWRSGLSSGWDATQLRGWPLVAGPLHPQLLMCIVGGTVPLTLVFPSSIPSFSR